MDQRVGGHGGKREGAGAKSPDAPELPAIARYNEARARHEQVKADTAELELSIKRGEHLSRTAVQIASQTAVSAIVQTLRGLSDTLEREFALAPDVCEAISARVDEVLSDLGAQFRAMAGE